MLIPPRRPETQLQGSSDLLFNGSSNESYSTLLRLWYGTHRISKVGYVCYMKIKGNENMLSSGERNIRTTAKRAGREQVVHSLPAVGLFLCVSLSCALKVPVMHKTGTKVQILGLIHTIMYISDSLLPRINKLHGLRRAFLPPHAKNLWLSLLIPLDPINFANCIPLGLILPYFPTYCIAWQC